MRNAAGIWVPSISLDPTELPDTVTLQEWGGGLTS